MVGATQLLGAEAVAVAAAAGATGTAPGTAAAVAPVGVDCIWASNVGDGAPVTGMPWDCWKLEIAARVLDPM